MPVYGFWLWLINSEIISSRIHFHKYNFNRYESEYKEKQRPNRKRYLAKENNKYELKDKIENINNETGMNFKWKRTKFNNDTGSNDKNYFIDNVNVYNADDNVEPFSENKITLILDNKNGNGREENDKYLNNNYDENYNFKDNHHYHQNHKHDDVNDNTYHHNCSLDRYYVHLDYIIPNIY